MIRAKIISAHLKESIIEFKAKDEFSVTAGEYVILTKEEFEELSSEKNAINTSKELIENMCVSYRHDFGLMGIEEQNKLRFECEEWLRAYKKNSHIWNWTNYLQI